MMRKKCLHLLLTSIAFLLAFALWTVSLLFIDVKEIGPNGTTIGLSALNGFFHKLTGVHMTLYIITDWLGLVPIICALCFAVMGTYQWIKRKSIKKVDYTILMLGGFYITVISFYLLFETVIINYRPILINGCLEASYPSSTTMLVLCVMPTAALQLNTRVKNKIFKLCINIAIISFTIFMVFARLVSGVHWFSDVIGGVLLSKGLFFMYCFLCSLENVNKI